MNKETQMKSTAVMVILNYNDMKVTEKLTRSVMDRECLDRVVSLIIVLPTAPMSTLRIHL